MAAYTLYCRFGLGSLLLDCAQIRQLARMGQPNAASHRAALFAARPRTRASLISRAWLLAFAFDTVAISLALAGSGTALSSPTQPGAASSPSSAGSGLVVAIRRLVVMPKRCSNMLRSIRHKKLVMPRHKKLVSSRHR
ncbi:hypothetical protein ACWGS9_00010 [Bradyrhizobium sp. Arg314]